MTDKTVTTEPCDTTKAIYLLNHGWEFVEPRNQEQNRAPHRYTKKGASGMSNMMLEEAYALEKGNNDLVNPWTKQTETTTKRIALIVIPDGYKDAKEFAKDCGFELAEPFNGLWFHEEDGTVRAPKWSDT